MIHLILYSSPSLVCERYRRILLLFVHSTDRPYAGYFFWMHVINEQMGVMQGAQGCLTCRHLGLKHRTNLGINHPYHWTILLYNGKIYWTHQHSYHDPNVSVLKQKWLDRNCTYSLPLGGRNRLTNEREGGFVILPCHNGRD